MGRKQILNQYVLVENQDGSIGLTTSATSSASLDKISYEITLSGTISGVASVEYCNDEKITNDSVFKPLDFAEILSMDASAEPEYKIELDVSFRNVRFKWVPSVGTGNISVKVYGNTVGA